MYLSKKGGEAQSQKSIEYDVEETSLKPPGRSGRGLSTRSGINRKADDEEIVSSDRNENHIRGEQQQHTSNVSPGAFAVLGQSVEPRERGNLSPSPDEIASARMENSGTEEQHPQQNSTEQDTAIDMPLAAELKPEEEADFDERVRRVLAQHSVRAENVQAVENHKEEQYATGVETNTGCKKLLCNKPIMLVCAVLLVAVAVLVAVLAVVIGGNDDTSSSGEPETTTTPPFVDDTTSTPPPVLEHGRWQQVGQDLYGKSEWDKAGLSVSLSKDASIVAVGAPGVPRAASISGYVRIYQKDAASQTWVPMGQELIGEGTGDNFGFAVSLSSNGQIVAIGAIGNNDSGNDAGRVYVYQYNPTTHQWSPMGTNTIVGEAAGDAIGNSIALSNDGSVLVTGVWLTNAVGRVYQYDSSTSTWNRLGPGLVCDGAGTDFSVSVALSSGTPGNVVVAVGGSLRNPNSGGANLGQVCTYKLNDETVQWQPMGGHIVDSIGGEVLHVAVSLSGTGEDLAVGWSDRGVGVYHLDDDYSKVWEQVGDDIQGESNDDWFGLQVSLSQDGHVLAAGAPANNGNGIDSGHVRVYQHDDEAGGWVQIGQDIDGETANEFSGASISLCGNGTVIAVGSPDNLGDNGHAGQARVYEYALD